MIDHEEPICDDRNLQSLLYHEAENSDDVRMLDHIENCIRCQDRLEELVADEAEWQKAAVALTSQSSETEQTPPFSFRPTAWTNSMAQSLLSPPSHPEMLGRVGRYDVERLIGSGGMGVVFKAYDTELNRPVAVKLLAPYLAGNGAARNRFAREARAAAAVVDDHVVPIHNVETGNESGSEHPFLVMKYIAGGSLQQRLDRDGPLDVCEVLRIGMQTAKGLAAAHAQGLIHRDVKPSNILLDEGVDRALLTDFGLARATDDASLTRSGFHPGTPHYMSPEQVRGEAIDARSDLFGLGCVLYALCTGHPPFRSETSYAVLRRITDDTPRPIRETNPDVPEWLEQVVMKLLAKSASDRFESAEQVAELLEGCLAHVQQPTTTPLPVGVLSLGARAQPPSTLTLGNRLKATLQRRPPIGGLIAAAFFAFSLSFAGVLIVLEMNKGTLTIESEVDGIPIRITQGDTVVEQMIVTQGGVCTRIAAGKYVVEIDGQFHGILVEDKKVALKRGDEVTVRIVLASDSDAVLRTKNPSQSKDDERLLAASSLDEVWDNFLNRCPPDGVAVIRAANSRLGELNQDRLETLAAELDVSIVSMNLDVVQPIYYLVKDRVLLDHVTGPATENVLRKFIQTSAGNLTPRQAGVQPRSVVRFDCSYGLQDGGDATESWAGAVLAQHNGHVLLLGPTGIADYIRLGHTCFATFQTERGESVRIPIDVVYAGDPQTNGRAVYKAADAPSVPAVRLAPSKTKLKVGSRVLVALMRRKKQAVLPAAGIYEPGIRWQTQRVVTWGESRYGPGPNGIELFEVSTGGDQTGCMMFSPNGELIGLRWMGSNKGTESVVVPSAIKATLRAAIPYLGDRELKRQLSNLISEEVKEVFAAHFATPEALMEYYADCQFRDDTAGCLDCYSDKVIDQFAASYLITATGLQEMLRQADENPMGAHQRKQAERQRKSAEHLDALLKRSMIDAPTTIAKAALYQAAGSILDGLKGGESREPTQNELILTAAAPSMLKNPRQFVLEFSQFGDEEDDDNAEEKVRNHYSIESNEDRTWAIRAATKSRIRLEKANGRWWIEDCWPDDEAEEGEPDDASPATVD